MMNMETLVVVIEIGVFGPLYVAADTHGAWCRTTHAPVCGVEQVHADLGPWTVSSYSGPVGPHATFSPAAITWTEVTS